MDFMEDHQSPPSVKKVYSLFDSPYYGIKVSGNINSYDNLAILANNKDHNGQKKKKIQHLFNQDKIQKYIYPSEWEGFVDYLPKSAPVSHMETKMKQLTY